MKKAATLLLATALLGGCVFVPGDAGFAAFNTTKRSGYAMENVGHATKVGRACAKNILGLVGSGDSSIDTAKKNGGITKVLSVDYDIETYLLFGTVCTVVSGQ